MNVDVPLPRRARRRGRCLPAVLALFVLALLAFTTAEPASASPPDNDLFANAQAIAPLPFTDRGDLDGTTTEPGEPQVCNFQRQSVWYSFTPAAATAIKIDLNGSDFGVVANVYQSFAPGIGGLGFSGCMGSGGSMQLSASANTTYYIQAGSVSPGSAHLQLNVHEVLPPANDDFANATTIESLPFSDFSDRTAAGLESGEPTFTPCGPISHTIWYAFTPTQDTTVFAHGNAAGANSFIAVYTGGPVGNLTEVSCGTERNVWQAAAGKTYWIQVGSYDGQPGAPQSFGLEVAPPPSVAAFVSPPDPSVFDSAQFSASVFDPAAFGTVQSEHWDFGDGTSAEGFSPTHRYAADGQYTAKVTVTLNDGRSGSSSIQVDVKTHDVAITKMSVPQVASPGQAKSIVVSLTNRRYPETVQVQLAKSVPGGFASVGTLTLSVPAGKAIDFKFSYVFTDEDAAIGKVSFQATATVISARDALPADNTFTALATRVK
jgi:PKD repeat protein